MKLNKNGDSAGYRYSTPSAFAFLRSKKSLRLTSRGPEGAKLMSAVASAQWSEGGPSTTKMSPRKFPSRSRLEILFKSASTYFINESNEHHKPPRTKSCG